MWRRLFMKVLLEARVLFAQLHQALFMLTMQPLPQKMKALFVPLICAVHALVLPLLTLTLSR